jgi:hypothetical protein
MQATEEFLCRHGWDREQTEDMDLPGNCANELNAIHAGAAQWSSMRTTLMTGSGSFSGVGCAGSKDLRWKLCRLALAITLNENLRATPVNLFWKELFDAHSNRDDAEGERDIEKDIARRSREKQAKAAAPAAAPAEASAMATPAPRSPVDRAYDSRAPAMDFAEEKAAQLLRNAEKRAQAATAAPAATAPEPTAQASSFYSSTAARSSSASALRAPGSAKRAVSAHFTDTEEAPANEGTTSAQSAAPAATEDEDSRPFIGWHADYGRSRETSPAPASVTSDTHSERQVRDDRRPPGRGRSRSPSAQSHTSGRSTHSRTSHHHRERQPNLHPGTEHAVAIAGRSNTGYGQSVAQRITAGALAYHDDDCRHLRAGFPCAQVLYVEPEAPATEGIVLGICRKWNCNCCRVDPCRSTHICIHCLQEGHQGWVCPTSLEDCVTAQAINDRNQPRRPAQWEGSGWSWGRGYHGGKGKSWR